MITLDSVTRRYGDFTAVDDVCFTAEPGRVTGFLGPNGAGKSTTMRVIVGLTPPSTGSAHVGANVKSDCHCDASRQRRRRRFGVEHLAVEDHHLGEGDAARGDECHDDQIGNERVAGRGKDDQCTRHPDQRCDGDWHFEAPRLNPPSLRSSRLRTTR